MYAPGGKGPFPAIVLLHGCNGMWGRDGEPNPTYEAWAKHFQERGYVSLLLDSFGPRGQKEICTQGIRQIHPRRDRAGDAHAARRWLADRDDVLGERIHLLGWSNGGATVLYAVDGRGGESAKAGASFKSAVALYPGCKDLVSSSFAPRVPLLILAGGADDWTPARYCETLAAEAKDRGAQVQIDVYEGAHHAFDGVQGQVRFRPDVRNPSSPSGWGAHIGPHPTAREKSKVRVLEFIEAHR
jgi:dienelactone hydrolase